MGRLQSILFLFFTLTISFQSVAQIEKGNFFVGGTNDLNFIFSEQKLRDDPFPFSSVYEQKRLAFVLDTHLGYCLSEKWLIGAKIGYGYENIKAGSLSRNTHKVSLGPFAKRFFPLKEDFLLFAKIGIGWGLENTRGFKVPTDDSPSDVSYSLAEVGHGITYLLSQKTSFDISLLYHIYSYSRNDDSSSSILYYREQGIKMNIGFFVYI